jgi:hypothetical protein
MSRSALRSSGERWHRSLRQTGWLKAAYTLFSMRGPTTLHVALTVLSATLAMSANSLASQSVQQWTVQTTSDASHSSLSSVSCAAANSCVSVGYWSNLGLLSETWNGAQWRSEMFGPGYAGLTGVACGASTECLAVGVGFGGNVEGSLAARWNGQGWNIVHLPRANVERLSSVSCVSSNYCVAVGASEVGSRTGVVIHRWNGARWARQYRAPIQGGTDLDSLAGVSCVSARDCVAVGTSSGRVLIERWNGTAWHLQAAPSPHGEYELHSVSCVSATWCVAVGEKRAGDSSAHGAKWTRGRVFIEQWNGRSWRVQLAPTTSDGRLLGVSCGSAKFCVAVGSSGIIGAATVPLIESWNGLRWRLQPTASPGFWLSGVSCLPSGFCAAVGAQRSGSLIETLNTP